MIQLMIHQPRLQQPLPNESTHLLVPRRALLHIVAADETTKVSGSLIIPVSRCHRTAPNETPGN